jgi:hypothetical protein
MGKSNGKSRLTDAFYVEWGSMIYPEQQAAAAAGARWRFPEDDSGIRERAADLDCASVCSLQATSTSYTTSYKLQAPATPPATR